MTGCFVAGYCLMYLPVAQSNHPGIAGLLLMIVGGGAVALGRDPNGLANRFFELLPWMRRSGYPALVRRYPGLAFERVRRPLDDTADDDTEYDYADSDDEEVTHAIASS